MKFYQLFSGILEPTFIPKVEANDNTFAEVMGIVFQIAGALAFLVIVIAGLIFVTSAGNPDRAARARNAIIYAAVGLIVSVLATVIVNFVLNRL